MAGQLSWAHGADEEKGRRVCGILNPYPVTDIKCPVYSILPTIAGARCREGTKRVQDLGGEENRVAFGTVVTPVHILVLFHHYVIWSSRVLV